MVCHLSKRPYRPWVRYLQIPRHRQVTELDEPLGIMDCDPDLFVPDEEFFPQEWDGSEGERSVWTVQELDLVAYGVPSVFLRRIPEQAKKWKRAKVYVEPGAPDVFYFFISNVSALPTDVALRVPYCYYKIPNPNTPGWAPVVGRDDTLDLRRKPRSRATRGWPGSRSSIGSVTWKRREGNR